jgi:spermidine/putrescine transport system substrate-binding protein
LAAALLIAFGGQVQAAGKIVISNWDGYMPKDLLERFTVDTGIEAGLSIHATNEEIMGKVTASGGKGYDVLFVSSIYAELLNKLGLIEPLDHVKIPNMENLYSEAMQLPHDPGNRFSIPYTWGTTGLCYRSDLVKKAPQSWNDLLAPAGDVKGKETMLSTDRWLMAAAFLAMGKSVNSTDQETLDAAKAKLIEAKRNLLAYDDTAFYKRLVSGEAKVTQAWDGWCNFGIAENSAIKYVIPREGSELWVDTMVVTRASQSKDAAHKFIDYMLKTENGKWVADNIMYKTPNRQGMEAADDSVLEKYPNMAIPPAVLVKFEELRDLDEGQEAFSKTVTEILAAQ